MNFPAASALSNYGLVVLQYWALGPGVLLMTFLLLQEILVNVYGKCGMAFAESRMFNVASALFNVTSTKSFVPRLILFFTLSSAFAPLWFWAAARLRPVSYIRLAAATVMGASVLVFVCIYFSSVLGLGLLFVAAANQVGNPLLSFGFLGDDDVEVSEVGRKMLAVSELSKFFLLCVGMLLAATAWGPVPHLIIAGLFMLASLAMLVWFCHPIALSKAYRHLALSYAGQFGLLKHLGCFWLTLVAAVCDALGMMLAGFLVLSVSSDLDLYATFQAVTFGGAAAAVIWNYLFLCSRTAELRLNGSILGLAAMPGYEALKAVVIMGLAARPQHKAVLLVVCGVIDLIMGGRSSVLGLAGFVTLPSREVVSIWQMAAITAGSVSALLIVALARATSLAGAATSPWLLFGVVGGLEVLRGGCMAVMVRCYPAENLSAP